MSVIYNTQYVDEKYLSIVEPNLYYGSVLQPGVTFTDKYEKQAGGIFIHKLGGGKSTGVVPGTPGRDFTDELVADSLIQAVFNNNFQKSRKIFGVTAAAVAYSKKEAELAEALKQVSQGWQTSGVACMVYEGKNYNNPVPTTSSTIKADIIAMRKQLVDDGANPTFAIMSTSAFEAYLTFTGTQYTPAMNDGVLDGRSANLLGINLIEANLLNQSEAKFYDYTGTLRTVDLTEVDMIMGDAEAFSALNNFEMIRVVDSELFSGAKAQVETNAAYRVTNAEKLAVKFNTVNSI
jgi:hypothetical protein